MKLKELISEIISSTGFPDRNFKSESEYLYGEDLEQFKERILQTEEFSECEELIIMKYPVTILEGGRTVQNVTYKHQEGQKFKGKCYLLSLSLTPQMFDPKTMHTPVLDGACITPTMYDPTTFEPKKKIVLEFSPEFAQDQYIYGLGSPSMIEDAEKNGETIIRKQLHETLDKILDNPESYQIKGERGLLVRGYFEEIHSPSGVEKTDLIGINPEKQTHMMAYFFEKDEKHSKEGQVNLKLSSISIPIELSDKYVEELGSKSVNVTREEVEKFLEDNK
jgi:hypothetical protein